MSKSIWEQRLQLDKDRREFMVAAMAEYDKTYRENIRELQSECAQTTGHNWKCTDLGPLGNPWFTCTTCHATRVDSTDADRTRVRWRTAAVQDEIGVDGT